MAKKNPTPESKQQEQEKTQVQDQAAQEAQAAPEQEMPPMHLEVNARPIKPKGNLLGFADVTINGQFAVRGIKVVSGEHGLFMSMPSAPDGNGQYRDICFPVTSDFHKQLNQAVVTGYQQTLEQMHTAALNAQQQAQALPEAPHMAEPAMAQ